MSSRRLVINQAQGVHAFAELENFQQIESLLNIARGVDGIKSSEYNSLRDLWRTSIKSQNFFPIFS
jgi:hypothetical protein